MRDSLAAKIRELRNMKHIWAPGAPRADRNCERHSINDVIGSSHNNPTLEDLLNIANRLGLQDLSLVEVRSEQVPEPYEDSTFEVIQLYAYRKASDAEYAEAINDIWHKYQMCLQEAGNKRALYEQFRTLKAMFEPADCL